jgi:hypothetical protein
MIKLNNKLYTVVKNFISEDEVKLLKNYSKLAHRFNTSHFDSELNFDTGVYGDPVYESLMVSKTKKMSEICEKELVETVSYWRMYTYDATLKMHSDRPSCEYSVSVMIDTDNTPWPFIAGESSIDMKPGDGVIYKGCELKHGRPDPFKGDYHIQAFLHYVDKNGKYKDWIYDTRPSLGMPHTAKRM